MYTQRKGINVSALYKLAVKRQDVDARELYKESLDVFKESKIVDLDNVKVIYPGEYGESSEYCSYSELPESVKQLTALCVCLIRRWFNDLHSGRYTIIARFKLTYKPTDFWHETGIFKNDEIKCNNMEELIEKIAVRQNNLFVNEPKK